MIDEAWRVISDAARGTGLRDGTVIAGLVGVITLLALGFLVGGVDLLGRRWSHRAVGRTEKPRRPEEWYDGLIRQAASEATRVVRGRNEKFDRPGTSGDPPG
jgi:hypothetical protein